MPKSIPILPDSVLKKDRISLRSIPVNEYESTFSEETARFSKQELSGIYYDMLLLRTFESMLNEIKIKGSFRGVEYNHRGPAHLSIGQEASAVGQAFHLNSEDFFFGNHRSHGEILAKGMSAIRKSEDSFLERTMEQVHEGSTLKSLDQQLQSSEIAISHSSCCIGSEVKSKSIDFLLYGVLAEIFGRENGFNRGMGGSMHAFFTPFGIYPNNAIVGGSAGIAVGSALFKKVNSKPGIVIANIGDASASCGPVWEALCFASMDQFKTLWEEKRRGGLPILFNFVNNFYGMGGQPVGETGGFQTLARIGVGLNPQQMHAERIDGLNPFAVMDATLRQQARLISGEGPALLDTVTYRISGHSPSDASTYRDKSEIESWSQRDPIKSYRNHLLDSNVLTENEIESIEAEIDLRVLTALTLAIDLKASPRVDLKQPGNLLESTIFSNRSVESFAPEVEPELLQSVHENSRVKQLATRSRTGIGAEGDLLSHSKCIGIRDALFEAILHRFSHDSTLVAYGEENRDWGGAFAVYRGLTEILPYHRLFNSPIAEASIVASAVGYAISGGRALVELMYCDFLGRAGDEVFNQLAKWQSMSGGTLIMPVVLRVSVGAKYGAQHSQDWSSLCAHIPGLKVVFPATPYDAKGLMNSALAGTDPVVFFESQRIYDQSELFHGSVGVPEEYFEIPIGEPDIKRAGKDLTILTVGATLYRALKAAKILSDEHDIEAEVIDARSLVPFDYQIVLESVRKTGKILLCSDACERGSYLQTLAQNITSLAFDSLDCPPITLGARNWITPPDELEDAFFPFEADILREINRHLTPLRNFEKSDLDVDEELLRRCKLGV